MPEYIGQFNEKLNESVAHDDFFEKWIDYRTAITGFAKESIWSNGSAIILGAGNLFDIDLKKLISSVSDITLADIDRKAVLKGIERQDATGKLTVIKNDFAGMDEQAIFDDIRTYIYDSDESGLKEYLDEYRFSDSLDVHNFDNVLVSAVYTQLFIPQFMQLLGKSSEDIKEKMIESALSFAAGLISHVNDVIVNLAADDATICAWSDILEYNSADPALYDIKKHIDDHRWMDSFYESYIRDYGHGLGSFGIENLSERLKEPMHKWLIWPFTEHRTLIVKIISGIKAI